MRMGAAAQLDTGGLGIRLFGPCEVRVGGQPLPPLRYRKDLWLLALLVVRTGHDTPREALAVTLWPDADEAQALYYLRRSLSNLRHALGPEAGRLLSPTPRTLRLDLHGVFADVAAFDAALGRSAAWDAVTLRHISEEALGGAVSLYRGPLLADCDDEWVLPERTAREQAYFAALEALAARLAARAAYADAVRPLRLLTAADPYRESAHAALMQALADSGDRAAVRIVYQALRRTLRTDLNTDPAPETQALYRRLLLRPARPVAAPASDTARRPATVAAATDVPADRTGGRHLPVPLSDLIGRESDVEEVIGWIGRCRLVTLLGPGGIGKTRLSIAAAQAALPRFPDGVWFVDLAPLADPAQVAGAACRALEITEQTGRPAVESLADAVAGRILLVVLDNCEHLSDACASLADGLLTACPGVRVLATSRQPLGLPGEQSWAVPSLAMPPASASRAAGPEANPDTGEKDPAGLLEFAALRLFVERARQVDLSFRLTRRNAAAVADICRRLDGIPLALEMAAARTRSLSAAEILSRLDDRFRLLTGGSRAALPRQQTLRAALDWSFDLLSNPERIVLRRVTVFLGGWTTEAACVCIGEGVETRDVPDLVASLREKSLIVQDGQDEGQKRFRLLETVRQYAADRLQESGEAAAVRGRHRDHFLETAETAWRHLDSEEEQAWMKRLATEHDNLRAALSWCAETPGGGEKGLRIARALMWFWFTNGFLAEGKGHLERALQHEEAQERTLLRAKALDRAGILAYELGDFAAAQRHLSEALFIARDSRDPRSMSVTLGNMGNLAFAQGDEATASVLREQALSAAREAGDKSLITKGLSGVAHAAYSRSDLDRARLMYEECLAVCRELGDRHELAHVLHMLGDVVAAQGDAAQARALQTESLKLSSEVESQWHLIFALEGLGRALIAQGEAPRAAHLWGAAEAVRENIGLPHKCGEGEHLDSHVSQGQAAMGVSAFMAAWAAGKAMPPAQTIEDALRQPS